MLTPPAPHACRYYSEGVYYAEDCSTEELDHAVTLVGAATCHALLSCALPCCTLLCTAHLGCGDGNWEVGGRAGVWAEGGGSVCVRIGALPCCVRLCTAVPWSPRSAA